MFQTRKRLPQEKTRSPRLVRLLRFEQLESRQLLSSTPLNVQLPALSADTATLSLVGTNVQVIDTLSHTTIASQPLASTSAVVVQAANNVSDTLHIDYSGGLFGIPLAFNGAVGGTDALVIQGGQFTTSRYAATGPGAGSISPDGESISYTGLTSLQDTTTAANRVFDLTALAGASPQVRLADDGNTSNGLVTLDSNSTGAFTSQTFANPTGSLSVLGAAAGTTFYLNPLDPAFAATVSITGGAGNDTLVVRDGVSATVAFDGGAGTNAVVNRQALGAQQLTLTNVLTDVDRPLLFIPGFGGTGPNFNDPNGYQNWLLTRGPNPAQLSLEPYANDYSDIVQTMVNIGYSQGTTFFPVLWDWRLPVAVTNDGTPDGVLADVTAASLQTEGFDSGVGYLEYYLKQATQNWQTLTGAASTDVDIVTHSTGGLVARAYLQSAAYATANPPQDIPRVHNLVQVGAPEQGTASTFNFLEDNFSEKAASRVLAIGLNQAYDLVTQQGMTVTGPNGTSITPAWLNAQPNPETAFLSAYVSTFHDLLATYPDFGADLGQVGGNELLTDLNANGGITSFINQTTHTTIVYAQQADTHGQVTQEAGPQFSLGVSNLIDPFTDLIGHLPSSNETWFHFTNIPGDGTVPYESSALPFVGLNASNLSLVEITKEAAGSATPIQHTQLTTNLYSQKQILQALTGTPPASIPAADVSTNLALSAAQSAVRLIGLGVVNPLDFVNAGLGKVQSFISQVQGVVQPYLDKKLPLVDKSVGDFLNDPKNGIAYSFFQKLQTVVNGIPSSLSLADAQQKIDTALGLTPAEFNITLTGGLLSLNFDIDFSKTLASFYTLDLSALHLPIQGTIPLDLELDLKTKFSMQLDLGAYVADPNGGLGTDAIQLEVDQFEIGAKLSSQDINVTLAMSGLGNLTIQHGTASIGGILDVGLNSANNTISLAQILTTQSFLSLLSFTPQIPLSFNLPITADAGTSSFQLSGAADLIFSSANLLDGTLPQISLQVRGGLLSIDSYAYVTGNFAFQIGQDGTVQLSGGDPAVTKDVSLIEAGASNVNIFVGVGGPYFQDSNGDGKIDSSDTPLTAGARGFVISAASFGLALLTPTAGTDTSQYFAFKASGSVQTVGLPAGVGVQASNLNVQINGSTNDSAHVVDFAATYPADPVNNVPAGLAVATGGAPVYLDFADRFLQVDADVQLTVQSQTIGGHFDFTDAAGVLSVSASDVAMTLQADNKTILDLDNGSGNFQIGGTGIVGQVSLDLLHGPDFGTSVTVNPAHFALEVNTTANDVFTLNGQSVDLRANHLRIEVSGLDANTPTGLSILGNTLTADSFIFEQDGSTVSVSATGLGLDVSAGSTQILQLSNGTAALQFSSAGIAGKIALQLESGPQFAGLTLTAQDIELEVNTTGAAVPTINGVAVDLPQGPFVEVVLNTGHLAFGNLQFDVGSFTLVASGSDVSVDAEGLTLTVGPSASPTMVLTGAANFQFDSGAFTLVHASVSINQLNLGSWIQLTTPTLTLDNLTRSTDGTLTGQIGVSAAAAAIFPGRTFSASVTDSNNDGIALSGSFDLGTHAFGLTLDQFDLTVGSAFHASAQGVVITYDPTITGAQQLVEIDQGTLTLPQLGVSGTIQNLFIRTDGFSFGLLSIEKDSVTVGSLFTASHLTVTLTDFGVTYGQALDFSGSIGVTATSAALSFGSLSASVTAAPNSTDPGVTATFQFANGAFDSLVFTGAVAHFQIGSFVSITALGTTIDTGATGTTPYASFTQLSATVGSGNVSFGASVSDIAFLADGSFQAGQNFGFNIDFNSGTSTALHWPSWLPISIQQFGINWQNFTQDPADFTITVSASVTGLFNLPVTVSGTIQGLQIDIGKLVAGQDPIVGLGSFGVSVSGDLFGGTLDAELVGGLARIDKNNNLIPDGTTVPDSDVKDRIFFAGLQGGFDMGGVGGFTIQIGLSELGPLGVLLSAQLPTGILLDPNTGLSINNFVGGVQFFSALPTITSPDDLRGSAFTVSTTNVTPQTWLTTLEGQVVAQYQAVQANPGMSGFVAAFTQPMTIKGSATLFSEYVSQQAFNGVVTLEISTPNISAGEVGPKVFVGGTLNFADNKVSMSGKLYADLSHVNTGSVNVLFLSDVPDQVRLLTLKGVLNLGFVDANGNPVTTPTPSIQAPILSATSPTADLGNSQPNGGVIDQTQLNTNAYLDVVFRPTPGHQLDEASILDTDAEFSLDGPGAADVTGIGQPTDMGGGVFRYPIAGHFDIGQVNVHFIPGAWSDDAGTANEAQADESFTVFAQAAAFQIHLGSPLGAPQGPASAILELQAPNNLLSDPIIDISGSVTLKIDLTRPLFTLDVSGNLSLYYLGTVGAVAGRFVLDLDPAASGGTADNGFFGASTPALWGVLEIQGNLDKLKQYGLTVNGTALLEINTTGVTKTETITLQGLPGDTIFSVASSGLTSQLDGGALPATIVSAFANNNIQLPAGTGVSVINPGLEWEVTDAAQGNSHYFIELNSGTGQLDVKGEAQTFNLAPTTFAVSIAGELAFEQPANSGNEWFRLDGAFYMKIDASGLDVFATADLKIGNGNPSIFDFTASGLLIVNSQGLAAHLDVSLAIGSGAQTGFGLTGDFDLEMNTTSAVQSFQVPSSILALMSQDEKTKLGLGSSTTVTIPAGPPQLDGTTGAPAPYLVISGSGTLELKSVISMVGNFRLAITPNEIDLTADASTDIPVLGTLTGTAAFQIDASGLVGVATMSLGSSGSIPGVSVDANFFISVNTTGGARQIETYTVDTTNDATYGQVSASPSLQTVQDGVEVMAGGKLVLGPSGSSALTLEGQFTFIVSSTTLSITADGRVDLGVLGHLNIDGSLTVSSAGIVATLDISASGGLPGSGFSFSGFFELEVNTTSVPQPIQRLNIDTNTGQVNGTVADTLDPGAQLLLGGSLQLADVSTAFGSFSIGVDGMFTLAVTPSSLTVGIDASLNLFGASLHIDKTATITAPGIVLDDTVTVNTPMSLSSIVSLHGTFELRINTTSQAQGGVPAKTAEILVTNLDLDLLSTFHASGTLTIGIVNGGFTINIPSSDPLNFSFFGFGSFTLYGFLDSTTGAFQFSSDLSITLGDPNTFGASAYLSITIGNLGGTPQFDGSFSASGEIFGVTFASIAGSLDASGSNVTLSVTVSVLGVGDTQTWVLGSIGTPPPPPVLATLIDVSSYNDSADSSHDTPDANGTTLRLNMGTDAGYRGGSFGSDGTERYVITHVGNDANGETVRVNALGYSQVFHNVQKIIAHNTGIGDDRIELDPGITSVVTLNAGSGNVALVYQGSGSAVLNGGIGNDYLLGGSGTNVLNGGAGNDTLLGGSGPNTLNGGTGADSIRGGTGNDNITWNAGDGVDSIDGGGGIDTVTVSDANSGESIVLSQAGGQPQLTVGTTTLTLNNIAALALNLGAGGDNVSVGDLSGTSLTQLNVALGTHSTADAISLAGTAGNDTFTLSTAAGSLLVHEAGGLTTTIAQASAAIGDALTIHGNAGNDTIDASGVGAALMHLNLYGDDGNDIITGSPYADLIHGGAGADTIAGGGGSDVIHGDDGNNVLTGGSGGVTLYGGAGNDTLTAGVLPSALYGGDGNDSLIGHPGDTWVDGGTGTDTYTLDATAAATTVSLFGTTLSTTVNTTTRQLSLLGIESATINLGASASSVTIDNAPMTLTLNGGAGTDTFTINHLAAAATLNLGTGQSTTATVLDAQASLTVTGTGNDSQTLTVDRSADHANETGTLSGTALQGLGLGPNGIAFAGIDTLAINLGQGRNNLNVTGSPTAASTTVNGGGDADTYRVTGVGGTITLNGFGGTDTIQIIVPSAGFPASFKQTMNVGQSIENLSVDGSGLTGQTDWKDNRGDLTVSHQGTQLLDLVTTAAAHTSITSAAPLTDTLTVEDDVNQPQTVTMQSNTVQVQEGARVLFTNQFLNDPSVAPIVAPNSGGTSQVYTADQPGVVLDNFQRDTTTGALTLQQQIQGFVNTQTLSTTTAKTLLGNSISVDGAYAVVGAPGDFSNGGTPGAAYVYHDSGTQWILVATLTPGDRPASSEILADDFGQSVAIVGDTIVVGSPYSVSETGQTNVNQAVFNWTYQEGAVYVFKQNQGGTNNWGQAEKLVASDQPALGDVGVLREFGASVAIASDGTTTRILSGAPSYFDDTGNATEITGATYLFDNSGTGGAFQQIKEMFAPSNATFAYRFGAAVALAGQTAVVGAPSYNGSGGVPNAPPNLPGAIYVYQRDQGGSGNWGQSTSFTRGSDDDRFGSSVAVVAPVGGQPTVFASMATSDTAPYDGSVYVFHSNGTTWTQATVLHGTSGQNGDDFGSSLAVHNGQLLVGASGESHAPPNSLRQESGTLYLFQNADAGWQTIAPSLAARFQAPDPNPAAFNYDYIGWAGALSDSSIFTTAPFGAPTGSGFDYGYVFIFRTSLAGATSLAFDSPAAPTAVYAADGNTNSISVFQRNAATGQLTFIQAIQDGQAQFQPVSNTNANVVKVTGLTNADRVLASPNGTTVAATGFNATSIAFFSRDTTTGLLTFASALSDSTHLNHPTDFAFDSTGTFLYVLSSGRNSIVIYKDVSGTWTFQQELKNGQSGVTGMNDPVRLVLSGDGKNVYVAAQNSSSVAEFTRNTTTGLLTFLHALVNGQEGVDGIGGASAVTFSPDDSFVFVTGGSENAVAAFARDPGTGLLSFVQRVFNHQGNALGLDTPNSITASPDGHQVYIGSYAHDTGEQAGIGWFQIDTTAPPPTNFNVTYTGIHSLTVQTAGGDDSVSLGAVAEPAGGPSAVNIHTGDGNDAVVAQDTTNGQNVTIDLGTGADTLDLRATGTGAASKTTATGGAGANTFNVWSTGVGSTVSLTGGADDDTFRVVGTALGAPLTIAGGGADSSTGDTIAFDSKQQLTFPYIATSPFHPNPTTGALQIGTRVGTSLPVVTVANNNYQPVNYTSIETITLLTTPVANPGGPYPVNEASSITLNASNSSVTQGPGTYGWDLNGDGNFSDATGATPTLTWAQLNQLGILRAGTYPIRLLVTDAAGNIDEAATTIVVTNVAPTLGSFTASAGAVAGVPVTFTATASDVGGAGDPLTYAFDFNGDSVYDASNGTGVTTFAFVSAGTYTVGVRATDSDGASVSGTATVIVSAAVPAVYAISGPAIGTEGTSYSLTLGPTAQPATGWTINWGDGTTDALGGTASAKTHTYLDDGAYTISTLAATASGTFATNQVAVAIADVPPTPTISGLANTNEGTYTLALTAADRDPILGWSINWGDGSVTQTVFGSPAAVTHLFNGTNPAASYTITATAADAEGAYPANNLTVAVANVAPTIVSATTLAPAVEGSPMIFSVVATDPGNDPLTYAFDFNGDGQFDVSGSSPQASYTFPSDGTYTVAVRVSDGDGGLTTTTLPVTVYDVVPTLTLTSTPASAVVNEGSPFQLHLSLADPDNDPLHAYRVDWGDGTDQGFDATQDGLDPTHVYTNGGGTYTVVVYDVSTDNHTYGALGTLQVTVQDVPPQIALGGAAQVIQGLPYTLTLGAVTDPGHEVISSYTVNWGDGQISTFGGAPSATPTLTHVYAATGTPTIQVELDDRNGPHPDAGQLSLQVTSEHLPIASAGPGYSVPEGGSIQLDASTSSDPDQPGAALTYAWDFHGLGTFTDATGVAPTFSAAGFDGPSAVTVELRVTDPRGLTSVTSVGISITNVAPVATLTNDGPIDEGMSATASFSNPIDPAPADAATLHYSFAHSEAGLAATYVAAGTSPAQAFPFGEAGTYTIWGRIMDKDGGYTDYSTDVTVNDVAPSATLINKGPVQEASPVTVTFMDPSDPSLADTNAGFRYSFASDPALLATTYAAASPSASTTFTFDNNGAYTVYGRIFAQDGAYGDFTTPITVTNVPPTASFSNSGPVDEGSSAATVTFSNQYDVSTADRAAGFTYSYDFGNTGTFEITRSSSPTAGVPSALLADGPASLVVRGRIYDQDGGFTDYLTTITINNVPPTATFASSGSVNEGSPATVNFTKQSDVSPVDRAAGFSYSYDFNNDGVFEISNSSSATAAVPTALLDDGPATLHIHGRITDKDGGYSDYYTDLIVNNVAPTATITAPAVVDEGASFAVSLSNLYDPSQADTLAGFHYALALDGASLANATYANSGTSATQNVVFDDGPSDHTVTMRVFDKNNGFTDYPANIHVDNVPPLATLVAPTTVNEGSSFSVGLTGASDPSQADTRAGFQYAFSVDGGAFTPLEASATQNFSFDDGPSDHTIVERIYDKDNGFTDYTAAIHVNNVAPTATLVAPTMVDEGSTFSVGLTGASDPSQADTRAGFQYSFSVDGGGFTALGTAATQNFSFDDGPSDHTIVERIYDKDGGFTAYPANIHVDNVPPTALLSAPTMVDEGSTFSVSLTGASDPSQADTRAGFQYTFSVDGSVFTALSTAATQNFSFDDGPSDHTIVERIYDKDGGFTAYPANIHVDNVPPIAVLSAPTVVNEGSVFSVSLTGASDPSQADTRAGFHYAFAVDGATLAGATYASSGTNAAKSFSFVDGPSDHTITERIFDKDGGYTDYTAPIHVNNVAPTVTAAPDQNGLTGVPSAVKLGSFTDPGTVDNPWTVDVNWGDGSADTVFTTSTQGALAAQPHAYGATGTYTVTITVTDKDHGSGQASTHVTVLASLFILDPSAAGALSVSGNGSINVPGTVVVDSSSKQAISASGNAHLTAAGFVVDGGVQTSGNAYLHGPIKTGVFTPNPLAGLIYSPSLTSPLAAIKVTKGTMTLNPGTYAGLSVSGNGTLVLKPGVYVLDGGGFSVAGNGSVTGTDVMIYNTGTAKTGYGAFSVSGNGTTQLSPATTAGPAFVGIVFFQDPADNKAISLSGNGATGLSGTLYAPTAQVNISGNATLALTVLADRLSISGNGGSNLVAAGSAADTGAATAPLFVSVSQFPVGTRWVSLQGDGVAVTDAEEARVAAALATLNGTFRPYGLTLLETASPVRADIRIHLADTSPAGGEADGILGFTTFTGDITIVQGWNWYTGAAPGLIGSSQFDFQTVVTHELGHALGLGHSPDPTSVMFASLAPGAVRRNLAASDLTVPDSDRGEVGGAPLHAELGVAQLAPASSAPPPVVLTALARPSALPGAHSAVESALTPVALLAAPASGASAVPVFAAWPGAALPEPFARTVQGGTPFPLTTDRGPSFASAWDDEVVADFFEPSSGATAERPDLVENRDAGATLLSLAGAVDFFALKSGAGLLNEPNSAVIALETASANRLDAKLLDILALGLLSAGVQQHLTTAQAPGESRSRSKHAFLKP
jgi:6-phosphogluconolactonase (cycloisomerase 2 family)